MTLLVSLSIFALIVSMPKEGTGAVFAHARSIGFGESPLQYEFALWELQQDDDEAADDDGSEFRLAESLRPFLIRVADPAPPRDDFAGDLKLNDITTWPELQLALAAAVDEPRQVVIDLGGRVLEQGEHGRASIKGDDLRLFNGTIDGQVELNQNAERIVIENVRFVLGEGEDAIRTRRRNGTHPRDVLLRDITVEGANASHAIDCSRGIERLRVERLTASGVRYGAYFDGNSRDITLIEPRISDIASEHGLRLQNTERANVLGGAIEAGPKTAITIRRGVRDFALLGVSTKGQVSIGPDKRDFGHPVNTERITIAGCTIDTRGRRDRPIILWPPVVDSRIIGNQCLNDAASGGGYLLIAERQFNREPQPVIIKDNALNGAPMPVPQGVDGPAELIRDT